MVRCANWPNLTECSLPSSCRLEKVNTIIDASGIERILAKDTIGLRCDIKKGYTFNLNISLIRYNLSTARCYFKGDKNDGIIELRWPRSESSILESSLNITNLFDIVTTFYSRFSLNLVNIKQFGHKMFKNYNGFAIDINRVLCTNCKFDFVSGEKLLETCDDFIKTNATEIQSIFQLYSLDFYWDQFFNIPVYYRNYINFTIINGDFKQPLCPIVFQNSVIRVFQIIGLVDSFYKRNVLSFSDHTFPFMVSQIKKFQLDKSENINLNLKLLNPDVFREIESIYVYGSVNRIDEEIFKTFKWLSLISFKTNYFRKIAHKNGINWIRGINSDLNVNVSDEKSIIGNFSLLKYINMDCFYYSQEERMPLVFPDEDFCLYVDYPFSQLVLLVQLCGSEVYYSISPEFSCTYMWLIQYYQTYYNVFYSQYFYDEIIFNRPFKYYDHINNIYRDLKSPKYNSTMSRCDFKSMKSRCDKSRYSVRDIWGLYDYSMLNKKLEIAFKISSYLFSFLGIINNMLVVLIIVHKTNSDIFKGYKQYDYLCCNSIFSILILVVQLLSWMSECFYPYEVFCPEIRKLVFIQLFKMVFKECFITAFRFMCNFTYVAFALNRISLIGKDHGKLVKFVSEVGIKSYLVVCFLISCGFSVIKYFKYEINYDQPETSYPIANDHDLSSIHRTHISNDAVIIANSIFDILNYAVFEVLIFIIDVYLVVLLRRTLNEKMRKSESLMATGQAGKKKLESLKQENEATINKVIKMVILNTAISVLFRLPIAFIPVVNVFAEFYYKNYLNQFNHPKFGEFYSFLLNSGFYDSIVYCSDLFFNVSLFTQLFIYRHFDKLFTNGLHRFLVEKNASKISNKM